ncbi:MAG: thymidine phosphorylase [Anaerolineales bacterium]|nr:thymidine phosphorylase [Anaerolineales bacterium]
MNPVDIIVKKRDGHELSHDEINFFIQGLTHGAIPDYQVAAWAMAVYFRGMTDRETTDLTLAMAASGEQLDLHDALPPGAIIVDKHSSGGVGDKTTLAVGPIAAACGLPVGKMSGRGLSFTGGTIDKLESIPGWSPDLSEAQFRHQLREIGLVVAAQTADLAPADKTLYPLRDVTGTVPSLPLIASSIMSKKLAAGADAIVLDVKCGRGAFMENLEAALALSRLMVAIGRLSGRSTTALITQMEQPLGRAVGNAMETQEAIRTLQGGGPADFQALVEIVAGEMLRIAGAADDEHTARPQVRAAIESGAAFEKFRAFVAAQGGDVRTVDDPTLLPSAPVRLDVKAGVDGYVHAIDARAIGLTVVALGGGRQRKGEPIDMRVGVMVNAKVGDHVAAGDALCTVHAGDEQAANHVVDRLHAAYQLGHYPVAPLPILLDRVGAEDFEP